MCFVDLEYKLFTGNFWFNLEFATVQNEGLNLCCRRKLRRVVMICFVLTFWAQNCGSEGIFHVVLSDRPCYFASVPRLKSALSAVGRQENDGAARPSTYDNKR